LKIKNKIKKAARVGAAKIGYDVVDCGEQSKIVPKDQAKSEYMQ
jgi:hypothetical protein